jgi:sugar transferase (PEP-CTERM/EpsH1 system associated)
MEIVFVTHKMPYPPNKGYQVKPFHIAKGFARRGHKVHLVCPANEGDVSLAKEKLGEFCASVTIVPTSKFESRAKAGLALANPSGRSLSVAYFESKALETVVDGLIKKHRIDGFMLYSSTTAQYVPAEFRERCIIDMGDVDSVKWGELATKTSFPMSWIYKTESKRLFEYEHWIVENFAGTNLATTAETALLTNLSTEAKENRLFASPNGVDTHLFSPGKIDKAAVEQLPANEQRFFDDLTCNPIVFTGAMDYEPNVEAVEYFVRDIMPLLRQKISNLRFLIVGANPVPRVSALDDGKSVFVTGFVDKTTPYFRFAKSVVVPLRLARGIQNRALEAMACACPIVSTALVAKGVLGESGKNMLIADEAQEFADAVTRLIADPDFAAQLGKNGRQLVLDKFEWTPIIDGFVDRLTHIVENKRPN